MTHSHLDWRSLLESEEPEEAIVVVQPKQLDGDEFSHRAVQQAYEQHSESVTDGVDEMRNEGGLAPEIPHQEERVDIDAGTTNLESL